MISLIFLCSPSFEMLLTVSLQLFEKLTLKQTFSRKTFAEESLDFQNNKFFVLVLNAKPICILHVVRSKETSTTAVEVAEQD